LGVAVFFGTALSHAAVLKRQKPLEEDHFKTSIFVPVTFWQISLNRLQYGWALT
jgi:hypothetical protein